MRVSCTRANSSYYGVAELEVYGVPAPNQPPVANAGPDQTGVVGQVLTFSGSGSSDPEGSIASYSWDWGDGTSGSGVTATKSYPSAGTRTVTLTVTDSAGLPASDTAIVTIGAAPVVTVSAPNGGEAWKRGSTYTIRWSYTGNPGTSVKIELLKAGVVNKTLSSSAAVGSGGAGSYSWKIASNQATGTDYRIRVTSTTVPVATDTSDANFTIN